MGIIFKKIARVAQLVEHHVANVDVASSNLVSRPTESLLAGAFLFLSNNNFAL